MRHCTKKALRHLKRVKAYFWNCGMAAKKLKNLPQDKMAERYLDRGENYADIERGVLESEDFRP